MFDFANEILIALRDVPDHLPRRQAGKKTHIATVHRWAARGSRGIRLQTVVVGGIRCTSVEAVHRFIERVTVARDGSSEPDIRTPAKRRRDHERAVAELDRAGVTA